MSLCAFVAYRGFIFEAVAKVSLLALLHALTLVEAGICGGQRSMQLNTHTHIKVVTTTHILVQILYSPIKRGSVKPIKIKKIKN